MPGSLRTWLYLIARLMGDANAVKRGRGAGESVDALLADSLGAVRLGICPGRTGAVLRWAWSRCNADRLTPVDVARPKVLGTTVALCGPPPSRQA